MEDKKQMEILKEHFKKTFHKKVDRVYWEHKYLMALAVIDNIEGMIGMRQKEKKETLEEHEKNCKFCHGTGYGNALNSRKEDNKNE